jgi:hypothetical protein
MRNKEEDNLMSSEFSVRHAKTLPFGLSWNWNFYTTWWAWQYDKFGTADLRVPEWGICNYLRLGWLSLYVFSPTTESNYNIVENNWKEKNNGS